MKNTPCMICCCPSPSLVFDTGITASLAMCGIVDLTLHRNCCGDMCLFVTHIVPQQITDIGKVIRSCSLPVPASCMETLLQEIVTSSYQASLEKSSDVELKLTAVSAGRLESFRSYVKVGLTPITNRIKAW